MTADDRPDMFGRTVADLIAEGEAKHPLRAVMWIAGDDSQPWHGFTDGSRWNGFLNVWITPAVWRQVEAFWHDGHGGAAGSFAAEGCALCPTPDDATPAELADIESARAALAPLADSGAYTGLVSLAYAYCTTEYWPADRAAPDDTLAELDRLAEQWKGGNR